MDAPTAIPARLALPRKPVFAGGQGESLADGREDKGHHRQVHGVEQPGRRDDEKDRSAESRLAGGAPFSAAGSALFYSLFNVIFVFSHIFSFLTSSNRNGTACAEAGVCRTSLYDVYDPAPDG